MPSEGRFVGRGRRPSGEGRGEGGLLKVRLVCRFRASAVLKREEGVHSHFDTLTLTRTRTYMEMG